MSAVFLKELKPQKKISGLDAASQGQISLRVPSPAGLLRRTVSREGSEPDRTGKSLLHSSRFKGIQIVRDTFLPLFWPQSCPNFGSSSK